MQHQNVDMVRSIGAAHVIDYTREDFSGGGRRYDLILNNLQNWSKGVPKAQIHGNP